MCLKLMQINYYAFYMIQNKQQIQDGLGRMGVCVCVCVCVCKYNIQQGYNHFIP